MSFQATPALSDVPPSAKWTTSVLCIFELKGERIQLTILPMILEQFPDIQRLSAGEKLLFVSELWNDLEQHPSEVPVSREMLEELDRRMENFHANPHQFTAWEAVQERILASSKC